MWRGYRGSRRAPSGLEASGTRGLLKVELSARAPQPQFLKRAPSTVLISLLLHAPELPKLKEDWRLLLRGGERRWESSLQHVLYTLLAGLEWRHHRS